MYEQEDRLIFLFFKNEYKEKRIRQKFCLSIKLTLALLRSTKNSKKNEEKKKEKFEENDGDKYDFTFLVACKAAPTFRLGNNVAF